MSSIEKLLLLRIAVRPGQFLPQADWQAEPISIHFVPIAKGQARPSLSFYDGKAIFKEGQWWEFKMKRRFIMMSLAIVAGLPHALYAKGGGGASVQAYSFSNAAYMPHYGAEGASKPLMDHISVAGAPSAGKIGDAWRLELTPPEAVSTADTPLTANDKRVGFTLKLGF